MTSAVYNNILMNNSTMLYFNKLALDESVTIQIELWGGEGGGCYKNEELNPLTRIHSISHLLNFIQTPRIMEATERRQDPASPLQEVTKRGSLLCKTDITDGKVSRHMVILHSKGNDSEGHIPSKEDRLQVVSFPNQREDQEKSIFPIRGKIVKSHFPIRGMIGKRSFPN